MANLSIIDGRRPRTTNHGIVRMVVPTSEIWRTNSKGNYWWDDRLLGLFTGGNDKDE